MIIKLLPEHEQPWHPGDPPPPIASLTHQYDKPISEDVARWLGRFPTEKLLAGVAVLTREELTDHVKGWVTEWGHLNDWIEPEHAAALGLFQVLDCISQATWCAGWIDAACTDTWTMILDPSLVQQARVFDRALLADNVRRCRTFAEAGGWWWATFDYAVPLAEWEREHGAMPRSAC